VTLIVVLCLLGGAQPALLAVLIARLAEGRPIVPTLAGIGVTLLAGEVISAALDVAKWSFYRRYEEYLLARIMRATVSAPRLELFEDPLLAVETSRAVQIARLEPGDLVDGLTALWAVRAKGLGAAVLIATVWPLAAIPLVAMWLVVTHHLRTSQLRTNRELWTGAVYRGDYYRRLAMLTEWAKEVRIFGLVDWLADRFGREWAAAVRQLREAQHVGGRTITALLCLVAAGNAVVLYLAARAALDGSLGVGGLTMLAQGLLGMVLISSQVGDALVEYGAERVPVLLDLERTVATQLPPPSGSISAGALPRQEIRFESVGFAYPGSDRPVFQNLDLRIEAGSSLGIVGLNGAGKTTLIKLLTGLETPTSGRITIDSTDLRELDQTTWRQAIAAIFQDFVRYELPARDNVRIGADDAAVLEAAARAGAGEVVDRLPNGLDTPLSRRFPGGVDLSGGQWQRIALARAIAAVDAGARVLVLDEPTAQLDVRAEADVYDRFLDLTSGLTTIVISHRFSTVRRADRIVVLDGGRITEDGTHEELLAAGGQYAGLFRKQATRYTTPSGADDD
jgi:ATP-binding cassette, subfamily B, bacterial